MFRPLRERRDPRQLSFRAHMIGLELLSKECLSNNRGMSFRERTVTVKETSRPYGGATFSEP
jgi:hypothetical protein